MGAGLGTVALLLSGCTANEIFFLDLPEPVTKEGNIERKMTDVSSRKKTLAKPVRVMRA